jgi:hypothetical protein
MEMSEAPKSDLHAYVIALQWEGGMGTLLATIEPTLAHAAALVTLAAVRGGNSPSPDTALIGVMHVELSLEWLRAAVRSIESGGKPAEVVSLVPKPRKEVMPVATVPPSIDTMPQPSEAGALNQGVMPAEVLDLQKQGAMLIQRDQRPGCYLHIWDVDGRCMNCGTEQYPA